MPKPWVDWTDEELANEAQTGIRGQGAVVEATRRLRVSTEKYSWALIFLTVILIFLTGAILWLTCVLVRHGS